MRSEVLKNKILLAFEEQLGIKLSDKQVGDFFIFMNLLIEKNKVMNLTAITDEEEIIIRHFVDSCMILKFYNFENLGYTVDIGTGAGFPGIPLAIVANTEIAENSTQESRSIVRASCASPFRIVLTDSLGKRVDFIRDVISELGLTNATSNHIRAEDFCHDSAYRESFDTVLSRGVAKLSVLSEYCLPALKVGGKMISYKMDDIKSELDQSQNAIQTLGGMFHMKHSYDLIPGEPTRCLVEIQKVSKTPNSYPRKAGTPSKKPL